MEWNKCYYVDCMNEENGLPTLEDKSIDLCITDPEWNINFGKNVSFNINFNKKKRKELVLQSFKYDDLRPDYHNWCDTWFKELKRITNGIIIHAGMPNLQFWVSKKEYKGMAIRYVSNSKSNGLISYRTCLSPIIFFGKHNRLNNDFFDYWGNIGFLRMKESYIHPCPLRYEFWEDLIKRLNPKSVIDPFMGSGTTAEVCKKLNIPWIGYEINEIYSQDVNKRLNKINLTKSGVSYWL